MSSGRQQHKPVDGYKISNRASKATKKGDRVSAHIPLILIPECYGGGARTKPSAKTSSSSARPFCNTCGKQLDDESSLLANSLPRSSSKTKIKINRAAYSCTKSSVESSSSSSSSSITVQYCSQVCAEATCDVHKLLAGSCCCTTDPQLAAVSQHIRNSSLGDSALYATALLFHAAAASDCEDDDSENMDDASKFLSQLAEQYRDEVYRDAAQSIAAGNPSTSLDIVEDSWALMKVACHGTSISQHLATPQFYVFVFLSLSSPYMHSQMISMQSLLQDYLQTELLSSARNCSAAQLSDILLELKPFVEYGFREDKVDVSAWFENNNSLSSLSLVVKQRMIARVCQLADAPSNEDDPFLAMKHRFLAVCPTLGPMRHSCAPNCVVVGDYSEHETTTDELNSGKLMASVIALHDIETDEVLTVSKIDNIQSLHEREASLREQFGHDFVCDCVRCQLERSQEVDAPSSDLYSFISRDLKVIGDLAMQQGRFDEAVMIYGRAKGTDSLHDDILHARGAAHLGNGSFQAAQKAWKEAHAIYPSHKGIALEVKKQEAYTLSKSGCAPRELPNFEKLIDTRCFLTEELLTKEECKLAIEFGEEAATEHGWTTSRHYAVPTTDLPIHGVPKLRDWFNSVMADRIRPLLALQFGEAEVGKLASRLMVHDAFIVRYDAQLQRHLPVHRDESTHSFTIALNDVSEYDGGGTYIADLGDAIRPNIGGLVSFRGDLLLHGGDPIIRGVRYVIVAFCYVLGGDDDATCDNLKKLGGKISNDAVAPQKRAKLKHIFKDSCNEDLGEDVPTSTTCTSGFSFGFEL